MGQENLYDDPCQDWLDLVNMKLTSPNYPEYYDPNTICKWFLTTDKGNYISLDFDLIFVSDEYLYNDFKTLKLLLATSNHLIFDSYGIMNLMKSQYMILMIMGIL